ncbi:MAG TPA: glycoside hydrolase family 127 protein [Candidatus Alistipes pullicola]|nr:glycoside hydrolase family 127 protein [Candidatus Alistipes pullicola]
MKKRSLLKTCCLLPLAGLMLSCGGDSATSVQTTDKEIPLPPNSIQLTGHLEGYIQNSIANWNKGRLPYDEFVNFFRTHAAPQFALGEMWGKAVRSGSMFYRYTKDPELKTILDNTVQDLLSTQNENGSISCTPVDQQPGSENGDLWERKYVMLGLEEYYQWVNPDSAVLNALKKHADCIIDQVGHAPKKEIVDLGWSATNIGYEPCHIESSTLLEPFMRLYNWTGEQRYLDFARYIVESGGTKHFDLIQQAYDNTDPYLMSGHYPKAYEMMSMFEGVVEYYRVTGDERCRQAFMNLFNNIRKREITIIGNAGADQPYHPNVAGEAWGNTAYEQTNPNITRMMETCVGVTWMKFCSQIMRLTGDPAPADEIEKYVYNGLLGAMKPTGDGFSYVNLLNGNKVVNYGWGWHFDDFYVTCCNLNGPMGLAYIPYVAVMTSEEGPIVNLYNAGEVNMNTRTQPLQLTIDTDFPLTGHVVINVNPEKAENFTMKLRIPSWSQNTALSVNGEKVEATPGTYAELNRKWNPGDRIEIDFDMTCRVINAPLGSNRAGDNFQAVVRGPIVLARDENIDPNFDQPVAIQADENGVVAITPVQPTLPSTKMEFLVPTSEGDIHMVDYASVDGWNGSKICTWLPILKK